MNNSSRTANSFKNVSVNLLLYGISYIAVFVGRTFFVKILGNDYLSASGLFTNVITLVSFSELGIASASIFCLYKPISEHDYTKVHALLSYFGKLYRIVAIVTIIIGVALVPALPVLVNMEELSFSQNYLVTIYLLFIINTACSYCMVPRKLFLTANQENYIANFIQQVIHVTQIVVQTILLMITRNYLLYLVIQIICTLLTNLLTERYVNKKYPELRPSHGSIVSIDKDEQREITRNITSIFSYKIGAVILNGTDNIIISTVLKTSLVGLCSNYTLVINAINSVVMQCFNGIGASIGNHSIEATKEEQEEVFRELDFLCVLVFSFCSVCLATLLNVLIPIWLGETYVLPQINVLSLVMAFYVTGVNQIPSLYRTSLGLFKEARFYPLVASVTNIVLSVVLAKMIGLSGVFWATVIVKVLFFSLVDSYFTYTKGFLMNPGRYYLRYLYRIAVLIATYCIVNTMIRRIVLHGFSGLIIDTIICALLTTFFLLVAYGWSGELKLLLKRLKKLLVCGQK